jgi:hypothetical protein
MLLLTDGSVLAQDAGTAFWWRLYPDRAGRYGQGEWRRTADSANAPLYFASAVLKDGQVFVAGGEYSNNESTASDLRTAEIYDPVAETWRSLTTPDGWSKIGDAPCCVLNDGRVLLGNIDAGPCAIWDPASEAWSAAGAKANDSSNEETWTLLPDGSVLTVDCFGQVDGQGSTSERFVKGAWIDNGATPAPLVETASIEIGPAILLPDGTVFAIGATGNTARFKPNVDPDKPGEWKPGPDVPLGGKEGLTPLAAKDAPACLLPNGRVLCAVGPVDGRKDSYAGPVTFFEFDPTGDGAWSAAIISPYADPGPPPYVLTCLLLPSGEVLISNGTSTVQLFEPDGDPAPSWAPIIETCPDAVTPGGDFVLQGMQLNGLSQACSYGDDAAMATNYPLVRLRAAFPSDTLVYCRAHDHSTMAVATGRSVESTKFTVPDGVKDGVWFLSVVANGIASSEWPVCVSAVRQADGRQDGDSPGAAGPKMFAEGEIFQRDLSKVHLLLDFISGRADKSLADLKDVDICDRDGKSVALTAPCVVEEICKITYPPLGGTEAKARQAAFLVIVTDRLNHLAYPARDLTIAFTLMFSGVRTSFDTTSIFSRLRDFFALVFSSRQRAKPPPPAAISTARNAHPEFEARAADFRTWYDRLPMYAGGLLALVIFLNWDVNITTSSLDRINLAVSQSQKLIGNLDAFAPTPDRCLDANTPTSKLTLPQQNLCTKANDLRTEVSSSRQDLATTLRNRGWTPIGASVALFGPSPTKSPNTALESFVKALVDSLNTIVIPALFGWLGTLAGLIRSITAKIRDSVLAPRDFQMSRGAIFLGVVAGLTVGLFIKATGGGGDMIVPAGLSFLAGFGAEAFFGFLDGLLTRIFAPSRAATGQVAAPK